MNCAPSPSFLQLHSYLTCPSWKKLRKAGHEGLNIRAAEKYQPLQEVEAATMVIDILKDPDHWDDHLRRYVYYFLCASNCAHRFLKYYCINCPLRSVRMAPDRVEG